MRILIVLLLLSAAQVQAAIVTRYFSTAGAGAADGTSWANRAQLVNAGTVSTVITGFSFAGSDSLVCYVGPGNYTFTSALTTGLAPTAANPLFFHGCDSSGNPLTPPDPDWLSCKPSWDDSGLPVFITTTNVATVANAATIYRLIKFTASGRNGAIVTGAAALDWCSITNSTANTAADGVNANIGRMQNCLVTMSGSSYNAGIVPQGANLFDNCRIMGVTGSSGDRRGIENNGTTTGPLIVRCTIIRHGGAGIASASTNAGQLFYVTSSVIANNGGTGIETASTASQTAYHQFRNNMVTGNGVYGIDAAGEGQVIALANRLRDNTTANTNGLDNWPTDLGNYTTDSDDASEYVDASNGTTSLQDYTIKSSATIATMGFGVAVQSSGGQRGFSQ